MNTNAIIANMGNGNVSTGNISIGEINQNNVANNGSRDEFLRLIDEIKTEVDSLEDVSASEAVKLMQEETKKKSWNKKILGFMLDTLQKTGVTLAAKGLSTLTAKAIAFLPMG